MPPASLRQIKNSRPARKVIQMPQQNGNDSWVPVVRLDVTTASKTAFEEAVAIFARETRERETAGTLPALAPLQDGWTEVTPQIAEAWLMHSAGNRPMVYPTVKVYAQDMLADDWRPTGETIIFGSGKLRNGHHRLWACYLTGRSFRVFVVASAPDFANDFAYLDIGKRRTNADALSIAGWNGEGKSIATTISQLAIRYDRGVLGVEAQPRTRPVNTRETLAYMTAHPDFKEAAHHVLSNYGEAIAIVGSKPAVTFFGWLVMRAYGEAVLDDFLTSVTTGANLDEDSPVLALRNKLATLTTVVEGRQPKVHARTKLAFLNKAFLMHVRGQRMSRTRGGRVQPLTVDVREEFPRIEIPTAEVTTDTSVGESAAPAA